LYVPLITNSLIWSLLVFLVLNLFACSVQSQEIGENILGVVGPGLIRQIIAHQLRFFGWSQTFGLLIRVHTSDPPQVACSYLFHYHRKKVQDLLVLIDWWGQQWAPFCGPHIFSRRSNAIGATLLLEPSGQNYWIPFSFK
jgi:hypothetical protein